jgi:hypothetical protein
MSESNTVDGTISESVKKIYEDIGLKSWNMGNAHRSVALEPRYKTVQEVIKDLDQVNVNAKYLYMPPNFDTPPNPIWEWGYFSADHPSTVYLTPADAVLIGMTKNPEWGNQRKQQIEEYLRRRHAKPTTAPIRFIENQLQQLEYKYTYAKEIVDKWDNLQLAKRDIAMKFLAGSNLRWGMVDFLMNPKREHLRQSDYAEAMENVSKKRKLQGGKRKNKRSYRKTSSKSKSYHKRRSTKH